MKPPSEQKFLNRKNGQYLDVLPLAQNYIANASCRFTSNNPGDQDYGGGKQKAWCKKRKYDSIFSLLLQLLPLQLFQDHRGGNLEAVGMTMVCCLHQAVPSRSQVIVPIRDILDRGVVVRGRGPSVSMEARRS
jgi:hypothetical protein